MIGLLFQVGINYLAFKSISDTSLGIYKKVAMIVFPSLSLMYFILSSLVTFSWGDLINLKVILMTILGPIIVQYCVNIFFEDWIRGKK
jgi:hypothetical protein